MSVTLKKILGILVIEFRASTQISNSSTLSYIFSIDFILR